MRDRLRTWTRRALVIFAVAVPVVPVSMFLAFEASSQPAFCGSCHIMEPYYDSWLTSSHRDVACVECHIPPGIESELRKKYEALSMVTSYFTGTYSTNPWTEVDDQSCLRSGCHAKRLLLGTEVYHGVLFDHRPHLLEMRREKQLRCTSCHSQIVQGSHISVTPTTCILCHFKDTPLNTGLARCTGCHSVPTKLITTGGLAFDHGDVQRFDMDCLACHAGVIRGNGEVPRERCVTCHNDPPRLARLGETEFMHRTHVTDHKVECLHCHIEIRHGTADHADTASTGCDSCHNAAAGHAAVRELYRGIGAKNVPPRPAAMFLAGVRCEACHTQSHGDHRVADAVSCMTCHGPPALGIFRGWQDGLEARLDGLQAMLSQAAGRLEAAHGNAAALDDARANLALVESGKPIHNPAYAATIFEQVYGDIVAALEAGGETVHPRRPWTQAPYASDCLGCHLGIETGEVFPFGQPFAHATHVAEAGLRCTVCHGDMSEHGRLKLTEDDCASCHERIEKPMADVAAEECLHCHAADLGPRSGTIRFPHDKHIASGLDCSLCHEGVGDQPHRTFARAANQPPKPGHGFCSTCHGGDVVAEDGTAPDDAKCNLCHTDF
jgi:nitrate/TMAO reductase-like tetraheme cytochrome c subunit